MAFGLSPKHKQDFPLENVSSAQFLVLAIEAATKLKWNIGYTSEKGFIAYTGFSLSSTGEEVKVRIDEENANLKSECTGNQMVDWGKNKENIEKLITTINDLKEIRTAEELEQKYEELRPNLTSDEDDLLRQAPATTKENLTSAIAIFKPTKGYFITPILIDLNLALFIAMIASGANIMLPDNQTLLNWGANFRPMTMSGQWWRLLTSCFLHIGILHLVMNMYALLYIGILLEPYLGKIKFTTGYLLTGLVASLSSLWWHDLTISAGASGAIFGMYGIFLALLTTNLIEKSARTALLTSMAVFVGYNLLNGMKEGVDNAAHIGGLISGLLIGYAYVYGLKKPESRAINNGVVILPVLLILVGSFSVFNIIPNDIGQYDEKMKIFSSNEEMALAMYNLPESTPSEKWLFEIKHNGLPKWKENIELLKDLKKLDLPFELEWQNDLLLHYCDLRIKAYNLIYKAISEDTEKYQDSIAVYNGNIEAVLDSLKGK